MVKTYILIDGSYYVFYRFFALVNWWRLSHKDDPEPIRDLEENEEFVIKFKKMLIDKLKEIPKKIGIHKDTDVKYIFAFDCKREDIWRTKIYPEYKGTRGNYNDKDINPGPFFKMVYQDGIFENLENNQDLDFSIIRNNHLEADDCIAITTKFLLSKCEENDEEVDINIITSDTDYLQLIEDNVKLFNLKYKHVNTEKNSIGCKLKDLLYKIIIGDKSDNIPSLFPKCGPKKTMKYINDIKLFREHLDKYNVKKQYELNKTLIDFSCIPNDLQDELIKKIERIL